MESRKNKIMFGAMILGFTLWNEIPGKDKK